MKTRWLAGCCKKIVYSCGHFRPLLWRYYYLPHCNCVVLGVSFPVCGPSSREEVVLFISKSLDSGEWSAGWIWSISCCAQIDWVWLRLYFCCFRVVYVLFVCFFLPFLFSFSLLGVFARVWRLECIVFCWSDQHVNQNEIDNAHGLRDVWVTSATCRICIWLCKIDMFYRESWIILCAPNKSC